MVAEASVPWVNQSIETGIDEIRVQIAETLNDGFLNFGIVSEMVTCQVRRYENHSVRDPGCREGVPIYHSWYRIPSAHSWYRSEGPGASIHFKGDRKGQTALARLISGHLKTLRFSRGDKKFNICTKCNMIEATPQHLLDCVALVYDDLLKRPDFVLEVMKANDLMDLI
ncbi:hypothetical protein AVEN_196661-1 [Araneus ventricosus]|uniref:Uncharacterized protein n=1 Tax=Araneus ventricosus TaxID=182803 RepID=A0A4Y2E5M3_ARAVE|nr:hypothetical protein AVEN_196661-1 [Araneus ventricosus]